MHLMKWKPFSESSHQYFYEQKNSYNQSALPFFAKTSE